MVETITLFHLKYVELDEISKRETITLFSLAPIPIAYNHTSFPEKFGMLRQKKKLLINTLNNW